MGRRGRRLPPLEAADIVRMLLRDGWHEVRGGKHRNFEHPSKRGKAQVSMAWTGVKKGSFPWMGLKTQTGWSNADFERLYFND